MANLYIYCPNIISSMYAQERLKDRFGFEILTDGKKPHFSDRFVVVSPPEFCGWHSSLMTNPSAWKFWIGSTKTCRSCKKLKTDKPVICYQKPTIDQDGNETYERGHAWIDLFSALSLISLLTTPCPRRKLKR